MIDVLLRSTSSLRATCKRATPAAIWRAGERVVMRKVCETHGRSEVVASPNADWYEHVVGFAPLLARLEAKKPVAQGCPFDCCPCTSHEQQAQLPIVPIRQCCFGIREPDGTNVPSCAYNTLYRDRDVRFAAKPAAPLITLGRGRP